MQIDQRFWPSLAHHLGQEARRRASLAIWVSALILVFAIGRFASPEPAPFNLTAGAMHSVIALLVGFCGGAVQMSAAANAGRTRLAPLFVSRFLFTGLAVLGARHLARALGQPVLSHPASTTLSLIATAFAMAALGLFVGRLKSPLIIAAALAFALVLALASALPLSPSNWSRLAVQTAVTGTGTRAAASALLALLGLGLAALIGARLKAQQTALVLVAVAWAGLTAYATLRPGPPLPGGSAAPVAPIASSFAPGPALESGLARITRQIEKWPPAADVWDDDYSDGEYEPSVPEPARPKGLSKPTVDFIYDVVLGDGKVPEGSTISQETVDAMRLGIITGEVPPRNAPLPAHPQPCWQ